MQEINFMNMDTNGIDTALASFYGSAYQLLNKDASYLIFKITTISDKVIKYTGKYLYVGDEWTSGSSITNQQECGSYSYSSSTPITLYLSNNGFIIEQVYSNYVYLLFTFKTLNGDALTGAVNNNYNSSTYNLYSHLILHSDMSRVDSLTIDIKYTATLPSGEVILYPIHLSKRTGFLLTKTDGSVDEILDLRGISTRERITTSTNIVTFGEVYYRDANGDTASFGCICLER